MSFIEEIRHFIEGIGHFIEFFKNRTVRVILLHRFRGLKSGLRDLSRMDVCHSYFFCFYHCFVRYLSARKTWLIIN
jgi:hypothetical protein